MTKVNDYSLLPSHCCIGPKSGHTSAYCKAVKPTMLFLHSGQFEARYLAHGCVFRVGPRTKEKSKGKCCCREHATQPAVPDWGISGWSSAVLASRSFRTSSVLIILCQPASCTVSTLFSNTATYRIARKFAQPQFHRYVSLGQIMRTAIRCPGQRRTTPLSFIYEANRRQPCR